MKRREEKEREEGISNAKEFRIYIKTKKIQKMISVVSP